MPHIQKPSPWGKINRNRGTEFELGKGKGGEEAPSEGVLHTYRIFCVCEEDTNNIKQIQHTVQLLYCCNNNGNIKSTRQLK